MLYFKLKFGVLRGGEGVQQVSSITMGNSDQYGTSRKLAARARLHQEYTIAESPWFPWIARQLQLNTGDSILDIGCGPGWFWAAVADILPDKLKLMLTDLSPGMISEAIERCRPLRFGSVDGREADAVDLPFEDDSFDMVVAMHVMYHLPDPATGIAEVFRVLKPGGRFAVTTNGVENMREIYELTTVFGNAPSDPSGAAFGYDLAERLMQSQFGNVVMSEHPARLSISDPEDVFLALTSYPPADSADEPQLLALRDAIGLAFERGNGLLEVQKAAGLFVSRKCC